MKLSVFVGNKPWSSFFSGDSIGHCKLEIQSHLMLETQVLKDFFLTNCWLVVEFPTQLKNMKYVKLDHLLQGSGFALNCLNLALKKKTPYFSHPRVFSCQGTYPKRLKETCQGLKSP